MSQTIYGLIDPQVTSGNMLAAMLTDLKEAMVSGFSGPTRPTELDPGGMWVDTSNDASGLWSLKIWTGSVDILIATINKTSGKAAITESDAFFNIEKVSADTYGAVLGLLKKRIAGGGQVLDGDTVGGIEYKAYTDTGVAQVVAKIEVVSTDDVTNTARGSYLRFYTTTDGTANLSEKVRITDDGKVGIGVTGPSEKLEVDGNIKGTIGKFTSKVETVAVESATVTTTGDVIVGGNLTVNGTTTTVNTENLETEDASILVNKGGTQASANLAVAGITVEMSDATDFQIGYASTVASKVVAGEVGALKELVNIDSAQTLTNKTITAAGNSITGLLHGVGVDNPTSGVHGVVGNLVGHSDLQTLTNKTIVGNANTISGLRHGTEVDNQSSGVHGVVGSVVGSTDAQTLTNKTIVGANNSISGLRHGVEVDSLASGVHGVTGDVVGTTDAQDVSNKAIISPSRLDVKKDTLSNLTTYAITAENGQMCFATDEKTMFQVVDGELVNVGSGSGGGVDFLSGYKITEFSTYKDAAASVPVDGTGGTAVYTSISALSGVNLIDSTKGLVNFRISKASGGNAQGEGISIPFVTRGAVDRATWLDVKLAHKDSVNYNDGKLVIFLYDVTNSRIIYPVDQTLYGSGLVRSDTFKFMTSADSDTYRLIFHVADTNTILAWDVDCTLSVSPQVGKVQGAYVSDWVLSDKNFSHILKATTTSPTIHSTPAVNSIYTKIVGDTIFIKGYYRHASSTTGTSAGSGTYYFDFSQLGVTEDMEKSVSLSSSLQKDSLHININGAGYYGMLANYGTTSRYLTLSTSATDTRMTFVASTDRPINVNAYAIEFECSFPIEGATSNMELSTSYSNRDIFCHLQRTTAFTYPATGTTYFKLSFPTSYYNTGGLTASGSDGSFQVIVEESGFFDVELILQTTTGSLGVVFDSFLVCGGQTFPKRFISQEVNSIVTTENRASKFLKKGDVITVNVRAYYGGTAPTLNHALGESYLIIKKSSSGSQTIAFPEIAYAEYNGGTAGQTIPNATHTSLIREVKVVDTHGAYNTTTGEYTCKFSGILEVSSVVLYVQSTAWTQEENCELYLRNTTTGKNKTMALTTQYDSTSTVMSLNGSVSLSVNKGDVVVINVYQNSDVSLATYGDGSADHVSYKLTPA